MGAVGEGVMGSAKGAAFIKLLKEWQFSREEDQTLWEFARSIGARVLTSPFDRRSVDFAEEMGSLAYKVAAFEVVNLEFSNLQNHFSRHFVLFQDQTVH